MLNLKEEDETKKKKNKINLTQKKKQKTTTARITTPFIALAVSAVLFLSLLAAVQLSNNNNNVAYAQESTYPTVTARCEEGNDPSTWNLIFSISNLDPTAEWYFYQIYFLSEQGYGGLGLQEGYLTVQEDPNPIVEMNIAKADYAPGTWFNLDLYLGVGSGEFAADYLLVANGNVVCEESPPPVLTVPANMEVKATSPDGAVVQYQVSVQDDVDGTAILREDGTITQDDIGGAFYISCTPASGSIFPIGETTVNCTAINVDGGKEGTASFTVTVNPAPTDTTPPDITVPEGFTVVATSPDGAEVSFEVTAVDDVDGAVDVSCNHNSGSTFPIGTTTVTCTAVDAAGNEGTASFTVTVNPAPTDTTPPDVKITGAADRSGGQITEGGTTTKSNIKISFTATDDVGIDSTECKLDSGAFTSCTSPVAYNGLSKGTHTFTVIATDAAGNSAQDEFTWTVGGNKNPSSSATTALSTAPATEEEEPATDEEAQEEQQQPTEEEPATTEEEATEEEPNDEGEEAPATDEGGDTTTDSAEQPTQQSNEGAPEEDTGGGSGQGPPDGRRGGDGRGGDDGGGGDDPREGDS